MIFDRSQVGLIEPPLVVFFSAEVKRAAII